MSQDLESIKRTLKDYILEDLLPGEDPDALEDTTPLVTAA
jgi:hypothetical protein